MRPTHYTLTRLSPPRTTSSPSATSPTPPSLPGTCPPTTATRGSWMLCTRGCGCRGSVGLHQAPWGSTPRRRGMSSICSWEGGKNWTVSSRLATLTPWSICTDTRTTSQEVWGGRLVREGLESRMGAYGRARLAPELTASHTLQVPTSHTNAKAVATSYTPAPAPLFQTSPQNTAGEAGRQTEEQRGRDRIQPSSNPSSPSGSLTAGQPGGRHVHEPACCPPSPRYRWTDIVTEDIPQ